MLNCFSFFNDDGRFSWSLVGFDLVCLVLFFFSRFYSFWFVDVLNIWELFMRFKYLCKVFDLKGEIVFVEIINWNIDWFIV